MYVKVKKLKGESVAVVTLFLNTKEVSWYYWSISWIFYRVAMAIQ